eukprot:CAMPEP_0174275418 /NCGR_PEP_ID=MMETSP0439-20130205/59814_1 /TAXON_ID=0 /ORGANISM="Stereomyxa ramosa, Strain Chinc5" /LENGTH=443 /DNA_ID=CAMNT_0015367519 /DNA_START=832 /DNA_END=2163 /DNA_ORIENTATION=+
MSRNKSGKEGNEHETEPERVNEGSLQLLFFLFLFLLMKASVLVLVAFLSFCSCALRDYSGYKVIRLTINTQDELTELEKYVLENNLDLWETNAIEKWADVMVEQDFVGRLTTDFPQHEVFISDVQALIQEQMIAPEDADFFEQYQTLSAIETFLQDLAKQYPDLAKYIQIGTSVEGNAITGLEITGKNANTTKPGIFYNGGQHAREWISPMTVTYIANELITKYGTDSEITTLVDTFTWTIIPVVNTDGYLYTYSDDRLWRKNRRQESGLCYGVDINRNWGFKWNTGGSSGQPCSETYRGPSSFSEPEETAVSKYIASHPNIVGYIDFHSYSQLWMNPWGWSTTEFPKDDAVQKECAKECVAAIKATHGMIYQYGNVATTIYIASGGSLDWTYGGSNVTYSYAVELRDTGRYGFLLPPDQIIPSGQEIVASVRTMGNYIKAKL